MCHQRLPTAAHALQQAVANQRHGDVECRTHRPHRVVKRHRRVGPEGLQRRDVGTMRVTHTVLDVRFERRNLRDTKQE